jgi:hypothetical protein
MKWIRWLYIIFLGIILSITTGFGLAAFYPQPIQPNYITTPSDIVSQSCYATPQNQASAECQRAFEKQKEQQQKDTEAQKTYMNLSAGYTRTAIFFGIVIGSFFAIIAIAIIKMSKLIANGLLLAAVLTAILTRLLITLASLGATTTGTNSPDKIAYAEFAVLLLLSLAIIFVGLFRLKDDKLSLKSLKKKVIN